MNLARAIKIMAAMEGLTYWEYVKKYQDKKNFGFIYQRINTAALLELEHMQKEIKRKRKYNKSIIDRIADYFEERKLKHAQQRYEREGIQS